MKTTTNRQMQFMCLCLVKGTDKGTARGERGRGEKRRNRVWHWYCNGNGDATSTAAVADGREQQIMLHNGRAAGGAASCKLPVVRCKLEAACWLWPAEELNALTMDAPRNR